MGLLFRETLREEQALDQVEAPWIKYSWLSNSQKTTRREKSNIRQ